MDTRQKKRQAAPTGKRRAARPGTTTEQRKASQAPRKKPVQTQRKAAAPAKRKPVQRAPRSTPPQPERRPTPDVVYTPAKPFNRNRLLLQLTTVVAVVLALTFGISIFFKVETVTVSGAEKYSAWTVKEASGIQVGDNLLTFGKAKASGKITAALPYVESVRIGIKLPDTVNIEIKELDVAYAIKDGADSWWLMTAEGRIVEKVDNGTAGEYTKIIGVQLQDPASGQQALALENQQMPDPTAESTEETVITVPVTVKASDRLTAALSILQYLEDEEVFGNVVSVDVTDLGNIELWYGQQYQVILGDTSQLSYKISLMNGAINGEKGLKEYDSGILDITFTTSQGEVVIYEPFD